jgi:hypothetical protein
MNPQLPSAVAGLKTSTANDVSWIDVQDPTTEAFALHVPVTDTINGKLVVKEVVIRPLR